MAARNTQAEVRAIAEFEDSLTLTPFINLANRFTDSVCTDSSLTEAQLKDIELYLSAHFASLREQRIASEKAGPVSASYQYKVGYRLDATMFGQQAILLDTSGALAELNRKKGRRTARINGIEPISPANS